MSNCLVSILLRPYSIVSRVKWLNQLSPVSSRLAADYGHLCHHMSSLQSLPAPALFAARSSESYFGTTLFTSYIQLGFSLCLLVSDLISLLAGEPLGMGDGSVYGGDGRPAFMHFGYTQTQLPTAATVLLFNLILLSSNPVIDLKILPLRCCFCTVINKNPR